MPYVAIIAAMDKNRVIGKDNKLPPWQAPGDLKRFKSLTEGKVVVMGRKTFESIGKPLPKRLNLIVSRTMQPSEGVYVARNLDEAIHQAADLGRQFNFGEEIMVIGGGEIYNQTLPVAHRLYITRVNGEYEGDAFFPEFNENEWELSAQEDLPTHSYLTYERR
jgi:dihydrofolate reductase